MDHAHEIIERLCTQAGMIMEDTLDAALIRSGEEVDHRLSRIAEAGRDIVSLAEAAAVLHRRNRRD